MRGSKVKQIRRTIYKGEDPSDKAYYIHKTTGTITSDKNRKIYKAAKKEYMTWTRKEKKLLFTV